MSPETAIINVLITIARSAPGLITGIAAAMEGGATEEEAIEAARAALPARLDPADPDPEGDARRRERIEARPPQTRVEAVTMLRLLTKADLAVLADEITTERLRRIGPATPPPDPPDDPPDNPFEPEGDG